MSRSSPLANLADNLPERHRAALAWFDQHAGDVVAWPEPLSDGTLLATKAKGIYKPAWSNYALSVRHSMDGPYPDRPIAEQADGLWSFDYFQESFDMTGKRDLFTNRGLFECWRDVVPVGVIYQVKKKPNPRYKILGLALVGGIDEGYFLFQGISRLVVRDLSEGEARPRPSIAPEQRADEIAALFDPRIVQDARRRVTAEVYRRQGQGAFRKQLLDGYGAKCPITGYDAVDALEAAHIVPYRGPVTNHPSNGLLLRADVHNLFDLGLISVDARSHEDCRVVVAPELSKTRYSDLAELRLDLPRVEWLRPSLEALRHHRQEAAF